VESRYQKLSEIERHRALKKLDGWALVEGREAITKRFNFTTFNEAFGWMCRVALVAEKMDHHPVWLNIYNVVDVTMITHNVSGLTTLDFEMAQKMDDLFKYS
jgi:4a-hydroxytetrahydrobiopterin dehydratase